MTFGLRLGYWLDPLPFVGLGLDVFYFSIPVPGQTVQATGTLQSEIAGEPITINRGTVSNTVDDLAGAGLFPYRYTFFPDYQVKNRNVTYEADVNTHHIVFGVSLRF